MDKLIQKLQDLGVAIKVDVDSLKEKAYGVSATSARSKLQDVRKIAQELRKLIMTNAKAAREKAKK